MKLRFESDLDYQRQAMEAVTGLFRGQEVSHDEFRLGPGPQRSLPAIEANLGIGNSLLLSDEALLANLRDVQWQNGLPLSESLASRDFTVEMETGTGKTYVYLRTIFELYRRYGFSKYVIVVPSVAIREGVYKTLQITEDHFHTLYGGLTAEYFTYDSGKPGLVRSFATGANLQIMIVTVGAINKQDVNNLYKRNESTDDYAPIDLIRATRPVLIVDEPQSVDGGLRGRGREALNAMNPLCVLRYSATHVDVHHMVYRLDAIDAYERNLVKQIEVASAEVHDAHNSPYVRLIGVESRRGEVSAKVELDVSDEGRVRRKVVSVFDGDDLEMQTHRSVYSGLHIGVISTGADPLMEVRGPVDERYLRPGDAIGDTHGDSIEREMIRRTIKEHFDKERRLRERGIKVLSLLFVDAVEKYRRYAEDGTVAKGDYALMFEEEFRRLARHPHYRDAFAGVDIDAASAAAHNGYFSVDRKGRWTNTSESNATSRDEAERAYRLIMQDKEELLSLRTPLRFIFSHSALREGWDNPNVFQVCALREIHSVRQRRQTIGRGLRLCVDSHGNRVREPEVNRLTVIAHEPFESFATNLQKEIEAETGTRFGIVDPLAFAAIPLDARLGAGTLGAEQSRRLWDDLRSRGLLGDKGEVLDTLRNLLRSGSLMLPSDLRRMRPAILAILTRAAGRVSVRNADERRPLRARPEFLNSDDFTKLWERISPRTQYEVSFDGEALINDCIQTLREAPPLLPARLQWQKAQIEMTRGGIEAVEREGASTVMLEEGVDHLPDILGALQERTQLTRRSVHRILVESGRLPDFRRNPQQFIEASADAINAAKARQVIAGIRYRQLSPADSYRPELLSEHEGFIYGEGSDTPVRKSLYDQLDTDSDVERRFAIRLEADESVRMYLKIPKWFHIQTPLGAYTPDWAIVADSPEGERVYFVVETKGSRDGGDLRPREAGKIDCARAHFRALQVRERPAEYHVATTLEELMAMRSS